MQLPRCEIRGEKIVRPLAENCRHTRKAQLYRKFSILYTLFFSAVIPYTILQLIFFSSPISFEKYVLFSCLHFRFHFLAVHFCSTLRFYKHIIENLYRVHTSPLFVSLLPSTSPSAAKVNRSFSSGVLRG